MSVRFLLRGVWSGKLMLDAFFIKKLLNLSVLEFGPIVASYFLDGETELLLTSSNKCLHFSLTVDEMWSAVYRVVCPQ
jgi:hypothetical protein